MIPKFKRFQQYLFIFGFTVFLNPLIGQTSEKPNGILITPGIYFPFEIPEYNPIEKWLILVRESKHRNKIKETPIKIFRQRPKPSDGVPERNMVVPKRQIPGSAICMFKNIPCIKTGPVETISINSGIIPNSPVNLVLLSGEKYELILVCRQPTGALNGEQLPASLILKHGEITQTLLSTSALFYAGKFAGVGNEGYPGIIWAGDLNGDGMLDLLINLQTHYCSQDPTLFVGTTHHGPQLVKIAAAHSSACD